MPRLEVLVDTGEEQSIVQAGRPAALVAFADEFGHGAPEGMRELAWLTHRALRLEMPLDEWLETLDDLTANPVEIERARAKKAGEEITAEQALDRAAGNLGLSPAALEQAILEADTPTPAPAGNGRGAVPVTTGAG